MFIAYIYISYYIISHKNNVANSYIAFGSVSDIYNILQLTRSQIQLTQYIVLNGRLTASHWPHTGREVNNFLQLSYKYMTSNNVYCYFPRSKVNTAQYSFTLSLLNIIEMYHAERETCCWWHRWYGGIEQRWKRFRAVSYTHLDVYKRQPL